ncbi:MAG: tRNA adenosine(34) deaminase TadA [Pseudomonadota bacterium]|nr:tRNA adenosine(34) deaminase TadA [Pseudomonadota bacterium]
MSKQSSSSTLNEQLDQAAQAERDESFMRLALAQAKKAEQLGEVPVGAVIVRDCIVLGEGHNQPISANDPTAHAEVMALRHAAKQVQNYRLPGATLYVTIEPCTMCLGALVHARISRIVYGATEPKAGVLKSQGQLHQADYFNHKIAVTGGVLSEACRAIVQEFFLARRKAKR